MCELSSKLNYCTLYNDNQSAQKLSVNPVFHKRSKHIDIRHHFIKDVIRKGFVEIKYLRTADMSADFFTKGLNTVKYCKFLEQLRIVSL